MFLTKDELIAWTGHKRPSYVMHWLDVRGYRYDIAADGWPRVLRESVCARLGGNIAPQEPRLNLG